MNNTQCMAVISAGLKIISQRRTNLGLLELQGKTGICSMPCDAAADCGAEAVCVPLSNVKVCLRTCVADADCLNGYICVADPDGSGSACFVEPTG